MPKRPVVGVPAVLTAAKWGFWEEPAHLVADTYISAVSDAGGLPLVIPPMGGDKAMLDQLLDQLHGLLLVGGTDLDPAEYGQVPHSVLETTSAARDAFEVPLVRAALERDIPILGVCRGLQVMNVATGGTLHQDLVTRGFSEHRPARGRLDDATFHETNIEVGTMLADILGVRSLPTNSHHHQGVADLGRGAIVAAWASSDRCVEALEWPSRRFVVGVQWHPEKPRMMGLFDALVAAARE